MNKVILLLASKMLELAGDDFSCRNDNNLSQDLIMLLKITVNEKDFCDKFNKWVGDKKIESFEEIEDYILTGFLAKELQNMIDFPITK